MNGLKFPECPNVEITGVKLKELSDEQLSVLFQQARCCQAMTEADLDTLRSMIAEDTIFTHMSGYQQTREEYLADIKSGSLTYYTIGISNPKIAVSGDTAEITYTSILNARAYGAWGTYRMSGTHRWEKRDGAWISVNR